MASRRGGKYLRKSAIPGVTITQYVDNIPKGCSTPDFERKPITLTLSEGKNAIFRAVVKGEPKPQVLWKRNSKEMDDPQKYQTSFIPSTNEFILQINKITSEDADLYRCTAVNEYGEATCTTGLKIIQVGFKKKTKEAPSVPQADLKKEIQDFRKILKKRAPTTAPKKELSMEQVWQLLLNADRKDYEKICLKYGIVDFRGMLRKLQEMKKEREDKQALYVSNLINLRHVKVNQEQRNASFDVEMDLKNPESRIYLYKDGQMINFGFNSDTVKHCLRQVGKKYNFIINDLQLEDAGLYQVKVEDVDIFSTELEAESIPVSFRHPLGELRCQEQGNAVFQCTLYDPCFSPMWFHKNCRLEANDKYDISVTKDGLTHRLVIKNTQLSDKGTYTIDIGSHSSSAWLEVEPSKGKRKKAEGDNDDKAGQQKKLLEEDHAKKFRQGVESENQEHFGIGKDGQHRNSQDGSEGTHDSFGKGKDGKMKWFSGAGVDMAEGDQFTTLGGNGVCGETGTGMGSLYNKHALLGDMGSRDAGGLLTPEGQDSALSGAGSGDRFGRARGMGTQDSTSGSSSVDRNQHGMGAISGAGVGFGMPGEVEGFYGNQVTLGGPGDRRDGGLYSKDSGQGDASGAGTGGIGALYGRDDKLAGIGLSSARGKDGIYGEDGKTGAVGITGDGAEIEMILHSRDGTIAGMLGTDGSNAGRRVDGLYAKDGTGAGVGAGASGIGGLHSKDGMTGGIGTGGPGDAEGISGLYGKDGMPGSMSVWTDKSGVPAGIDGFHGKNRMTGGTGICGPGGAEGVGGIYDRNGMIGGAGGPGDAAGISGRYSKGTVPGISAGGPGDAVGIGGVHGKGGILSGAGTVEPGSENGVLTGSGGPAGGTGRTGGLYSKDGMPAGVGLSGAGGAEIGGKHYRKEDMLGGAGAGGPGGASGIGKLYGKDMGGAGTDVSGGTGATGRLYGKDGMLDRAGSGGPGGVGIEGGQHGKDGMPIGAGTGGAGDRKYVVTDLKEGLQYEFRVAAINAAGVGEPSAPSEAAFARDPMNPPGPVRDLKVVSTDYCSISLSWMKPEAEDESCAKGYIVEIRHSDVLKWTQCNALPIPATTYTVRGLKAREMYFLRVRAINDGGLGDPVELDTCVQTIPPIVQPKLLVKDTVKSFMIVKSGNTIRVRIPFEASPTPDVVWLKDGLALPAKATVATRKGISQLIIPKADFSDSGHYTIILRTEHGSKVTFSFLVQVLDAPESPGPIQLVEKVPETVTLIWEPSPTEKKEGTLNYMVMMRDSTKGSWQLVADLIYTNKCTVANFMPGREYFFRVLAKNCMGISEPSETVQPWSIRKEKAKFELRLPRYKGINQTQPPRFLVPLKPHVVTLGFDCHMSCAVTGHPAPQVTWYKDGKNISQDHSFFSKNDFGVCSLVIPGVTPSDGGQYKVVAINELGQASSKAELTIKEPSF
ncbi:immunoglobulin-like and fibronectin type III domain-containing protein 1 [Varanus komodoensis]|uniref:immunoglobulin-like and fibronectin type III domain-containing protein 1 n=1 Tax=Varanus komodoensis TaxID=61221 RepID=UPI001CF77C85|nr:immunoglobulin-like and fibronectin type III domain-containing protein 1 [Varanus komodoensis]